MIDEEWLKQWQVEIGEGYRIDGVHVGGTNAACKIIYPNGKAWGIRFTRRLFEFPCYIHEIPNWVVQSPHYDVDRLNRKLTNLIGDSQLHIASEGYARLFTSLLEWYYQNEIADLDTLTWGSEAGPSDEGTRLWRFILQTPAISYRLDDYATSAKDLKKRTWAEQARSAIARMGPGDKELCPESFLENPLVVWGGAISEGFFTKAQFAQAADAVAECLRPLPKEQIRIFLSQASALITASDNLEGMRLSRFAQFCDVTGLFPWEFSTEEERAIPDQFGALLDAVKGFERQKRRKK